MIALGVLLAGCVGLVTYAMCRAAADADRQGEVAFRRYQERGMNLEREEDKDGSPPAIHG